MAGQPSDIKCNGIIEFGSEGGPPNLKNFHAVLADNWRSWACHRQRRRREIFIEQNKKEFPAPSGAASSVHCKHVHANVISNMPPLKRLEFL
jgi:hypothetical protein